MDSPAVARGGGLVRRHARKLAIAQVQLKRAAARAVDGAKRRRTGFGGFASESGIDWLHLTEQLVGYVRDRFHALIIAVALRAPLHALVIAPLSHSRESCAFACRSREGPSSPAPHARSLRYTGKLLYYNRFIEGERAMLDLKFVRENQEAVAQAMKNRHASWDASRFSELDEARRAAITEEEALQAERNASVQGASAR